VEDKSIFFNEFSKLYQQHFNKEINTFTQLPLSGSDRQYFRIEDNNGNSAIATFSQDKNETNSFLYFSRVFKKHHLPVPEIYTTSSNKKYYIQEDIGQESLFDLLQSEGYTDQIKSLYKKAIDQLVKFHWQAGREIDYSLCHASEKFDRKAILSDVLYFKYYFADLLKIEYDKNALLEELEEAAKSLASQKPQTFMYRDFQSRNILVKNNEVYFIDYQGGMLGLPQYDIASLLWQAKAQLPDDWKNELLNYYFEALKSLPEKPTFDETTFRRIYLDCVLLRILQTLGAYGFRGIFEKKPHFISSIYPALLQLKGFMQTWPHLPSSNELRKVLVQLVKPEILARFEPQKFDKESINKLKINIYSFSYKKGLPAKNDHGGGYVFDCRGILNPGKIEKYKQLTGKDAPVKEYLQSQTTMPKFLDSIFTILDISVQDYISRGFDQLQISFGCTGGQHRSVYAAEATKDYLYKKYGLEAEILHLEQDPNQIERR
jgi:aminoglycoside/choline kinase family phosphotransferase